jgi:hypothetical protein
VEAYGSTAGVASGGSAYFLWGDHVVGAELGGQAALVGVAGGGQYLGVWVLGSQGGDGYQAEGAGS